MKELDVLPTTTLVEDGRTIVVITGPVPTHWWTPPPRPRNRLTRED